MVKKASFPMRWNAEIPYYLCINDPSLLHNPFRLLFCGYCIQPKGDFGFTSQLSKLYDEFVQLNGSTSFDGFLAEELLDPYSPPEDDNEPPDEPFEKECHPVPIDLIAVNATITFYTVASIIETPPEPLQSISYVPFTENYTSTDLGSVFHPPRSEVHT